MRKNLTSYKKKIFKILLTKVFFLLLSAVAFGQCPPSNAISETWNQQTICAPARVDWTIGFKQTWSAGTTVKIRFKWKDGTTEDKATTPVTISGSTYYQVANTHNYASKGDKCKYDPEAVLLLDGMECNTRSTKNVTVWDKDNFNGGQLKINPTLYRICVGTSATVTFQDQSQFNCVPPQTFNNINKIHRWIQWIYGTYDNGTYSARTRIPGVEVNGTPVNPPTPLTGTISMLPTPVLGPNSSSLPVYVPAGGNIGDVFEIKLRNWNVCNPYDADTLNGLPPSNATDGDYPPITTTAIIEIVAAPTPLFERRKTSFSTSGDELNFCPNETIYLKNLTTAISGSDNQYTWKFYDNTNTELGSKTGADVTYSFSTPGDYKVKLFVKDANSVGNCNVELEKNIRIDASPVIVINVDGDGSSTHSYCKPDRTNPLSIALNGNVTSSNSYSYNWQFYKRNSSASAPDSSFTNTTLTSLNLDYNKPGIYKIRLSARDNLTQCLSFQESTIKIYDRPEAIFDASTVCAGERTNFSNISDITSSIQTKVDNDQVVTWEWDFNNDGNIDLIRNDDSDFDYFLATPFGPTEPSTSINGTYDVTLKVTTDKGCFHSVTKSVRVKSFPNPSFVTNPTNGEICNGGTIDFTSTTSSLPAITDYSWDFGPNANPKTAIGSSVTGIVFTNTTGADITYDVKLTVASDSGCSNSVTKTITIHPAPPITISSDFDASKPNCSPILVNFLHNGDPGTIDTYNWIVKNLNSNSEVYNTILSNNAVPFTPPATIFVNNNTVATDIDYEVRLIIKYINGCQVESNKVKVTVKPNPTADFTADFLNDCSPKKVKFLPNITDAAYYEWNFQNGHIPDYSSTTPSVPDIIFTNKSASVQDYLVELTITTIGGCKSTVSKKITVKPQPDPQFNILNNRILCSGEALEFKNTTVTGLPISKYVWIWGDGTPDTEVLTPGTDVVSHIFKNSSTDTTATYKVKLVAVSECEAYSNQQTVVVEPILIPDFEAFGANCSPAKITLSNKSKGPLAKINWFIDGNPQTAQGDNVTFELINSGTEIKDFNISMKITSDNGCDTTITKPVSIYPQAVAQFNATPSTLTMPDKTVTIENTTMGTWNYEWDFGDGSPLFTEKDPKVHEYPGVGQYRITLTISSEYCKSSTFKDITILSKKPIADFGPDHVEGCKPLTVHFTNHSSFADSTKYEWDFGDGKGKSNAVNPNYTYTEPGSYTVRLIAKNYQNLVDDTVKIDLIKVNDIPYASFLARPVLVELPDKPIYLTNQSLGADYYLWDFGDGNFSSDSDPAHIYLDTGRYTITLIAYNNAGCSDTAVVENAVKATYGGRVLIPNAFTPNLSAFGVGSSEDNDYFFPKAEGVVAMDLKIFDRWGELVYHTSNKDDKGWNGYYNGKLCQQDVYVYSVKIKFMDGYEVNKTGDVVLIR